jgi:hypothetical protein
VGQQHGVDSGRHPRIVDIAGTGNCSAGSIYGPNIHFKWTTSCADPDGEYMNEEMHRDHSDAQADDASAGPSFGRDDDANVAQATFAIKVADKAVLACDEIFVATLNNAARKAETSLGTAMVAIYRAVRTIEASGIGPRFLAERKVKVHGNTRNAYQPYFRAFAKRAHPFLRSKLCKQAEVIGLACHENVAPDDFAEWLNTHPVEQACKEFRRITREKSNSKHNKATRRIKELLIDPEKEPDKTPLRAATPLTQGMVGVKLFVAALVPDGRGDFRVLGTLPHEEDEVMRIVEAAMAGAKQ